MALNTWVARFVVDHGRVTEEGGRLRTFQRRRLDEADVDLHILCEPTGAKGEDLGSQTIEAIGRGFLQDRLSLTGGLARSLRTTHQTLLDWNRRSLPREQVAVSIAAAVVAGAVVYFSQCGPSSAFLMQNGRLRRLQPQEESANPLGEGELEPAIRRIDLQAGDVLVAASGALESLVTEQMLKDILERPSEEAMPELYLLTRDLPNFALFAVTCSEGPDEAETHSRLEQELEFALGGGGTPRIDTEPRRPALAEIEAINEDDASIDTPVRTFTLTREPALAIEPEAEAQLDLAKRSQAAVMNAPRPVDISKSVVKLRSDQSIGRSEYARTTGSPRPFRINLLDGKLLRFGAVAVVFLLVIAFVPGLVREGRSEKLSDLVAAAQTQLAAASTSTDPAERRKLLDDTRRLATEALRLDSENTLAADIRAQAAAAIQAQDAVFELNSMTTVSTLTRQITGDISLESLTVAAGTAFLLDTKGGRVISIPVGGGQPTTIYQDGETYGSIPAKKPLYFTWEGNDQAGRLLILDTERKLFEVRPGSNTPSPLALRRTNTWSSVSGIATYDGNLYILDPSGNQVHRYLPAATGFDSEPTAVLSGARDLANAQGLAVDSDIFIFHKDGQIKRFRSGTEIGFPLAGIDRTVRSATDLVLSNPSEEVYFADSGNKRIVVASKDGNFRRQYVSNSFTDIRSIALDASGEQIYVIAGDSLLSSPAIRD